MDKLSGNLRLTLLRNFIYEMNEQIDVKKVTRKCGVCEREILVFRVVNLEQRLIYFQMQSRQ
jgi:hypothetical protein